MAETTTTTAAATVLEAFSRKEDLSLSLTQEERCCLKTALVMAVVKRRAVAAAESRVSVRKSDDNTKQAQAPRNGHQTQVDPKSGRSVIADEGQNDDDGSKKRSVHLELEQLLTRVSSNRKGESMLASPGNPSHIRSMMDVAVTMAQQNYQRSKSTLMGVSLSTGIRRQLSGIVCHLADSLEMLLNLQQQEQLQELHGDDPSNPATSTNIGRYNIPGWIRETLVSAAACPVPLSTHEDADSSGNLAHEKNHRSTVSAKEKPKTEQRSKNKRHSPTSRLNGVVTVFRVMLLEHGMSQSETTGGRTSNKRPRFWSSTRTSVRQPLARCPTLLDLTILEVVATLLRDLYLGNEMEFTNSSNHAMAMNRSESAMANDLAVHCLLLLETMVMNNPNMLRELSSFFYSIEQEEGYEEQQQERRVGFDLTRGQHRQSSNSSVGTNTTPTSAMKRRDQHQHSQQHRQHQLQLKRESSPSIDIFNPIAISDLANYYQHHHELRLANQEKIRRIRNHRNVSRSRNSNSSTLEGATGGGEGSNASATATANTTTTLFLQLDPGAKILVHLGLYRILEKASAS